MKLIEAFAGLLLIVIAGLIVGAVLIPGFIHLVVTLLTANLGG